ncbi:hypothetical protein Q7P37_009103 [Cladosporium fusiforme]
MRLQELVTAAQCLLWPCNNDEVAATQQSSNICSSLKQLAPANVLESHDAAYKDRQTAYFAQQQVGLQPTCRYLPNGAEDLQVALQQLVESETKFAVQAGGHSYNVGGSNIDQGVTIDLSRLSKTEINDDASAAWVGPGARWKEVYDALEPHGVTIPGGRVSDVGVGGYVLGGGFSWYSGQFGWVCDSVIEFEVVTPDGRILHASADQHEDLFWALKGSLGAFGIVTRIKLPVIQNKEIYGGSVIYDPVEAPKLLTALEHLSNNAGQDPATQGIFNLVWNRSQKQRIYNLNLLNTNGDASAAAVANWTAIPNIMNVLHSTTIGQVTQELIPADFVKQRRNKFAITARSTKEVIDFIHSSYIDVTSNHTELNAPGDTCIITIQPLTRPHLAASAKGGNIFPLDDSEGPLLILTTELYWDDASQDEFYELRSRKLHDAWVEQLSVMGVMKGWVYPNYAGKWQETLSEAKMGKETVEKLRQVSEKYDGQGVWKRLVPGIWHV